MILDNFLYPTHQVRSIITGPTECGKAVILLIVISNNFIENEKM